MTSNNIIVSELTIDELLDLKEQVEVRLSTLAADELSAIENRAFRLKAYLGESKSPSAPAKPAAKPSNRSQAKPSRKRRKTKAASKRAKLPAKYRDPVSGKTWSGRGPAPQWLQEYAAKKGKNREDLAI